MDIIIQEFIEECMNNNLDNAKHIYERNNDIIKLNKILYDTKTSDIQGPYSLFECACIKNNLDIVKWFIEIGVSSTHYNDGFMSACQYNHIELVIYLHENKNNTVLNYQIPFIVCSYQGHFKLLKWLYENSEPKIDIHYDDESAFLYAIDQNHFEIAKWLQEKVIDVCASNNHAFISACFNGRIDMCKWLYNINKDVFSREKSRLLKNAKLSKNSEVIEFIEKIQDSYEIEKKNV